MFSTTSCSYLMYRVSGKKYRLIELLVGIVLKTQLKAILFIHVLTNCS